MKTTDRKVYDFDWMRMLKALLHKFWLPVLCGFIVAAIAFSCVYAFVTPKYASNFTIYVNNRTGVAANTSLNGITISDLSASQGLVDTYIVILKSRNTLERVMDKTKLDCSYEELSDMITAHSVNETEIFQVTVTTEDAQTSQRIASVLSGVLPNVISEIISETSVKVLDQAKLDNRRVSPSYTKVSIAGLFFGGLLGCLLVIWQDMTDDMIRSEDDLLQNYDVPVLAVIPSLDSESRSSYSYRRGSAYSRAYSRAYNNNNDNDDNDEGKAGTE